MTRPASVRDAPGERTAGTTHSRGPRRAPSPGAGPGADRAAVRRSASTRGEERRYQHRQVLAQVAEAVVGGKRPHRIGPDQTRQRAGKRQHGGSGCVGGPTGEQCRECERRERGGEHDEHVGQSAHGRWCRPEPEQQRRDVVAEAEAANRVQLEGMPSGILDVAGDNLRRRDEFVGHDSVRRHLRHGVKHAAERAHSQEPAERIPGSLGLRGGEASSGRLEHRALPRGGRMTPVAKPCNT